MDKISLNLYIKRKTVLTQATIQMKPENRIIRSQSQKTTYCMIPIFEISGKFIETESRLEVAMGWR